MFLDWRWGSGPGPDEKFVWAMSKIISIGSAVTQTSSAVASLLKYLGKSFDPLPGSVDLPGMVLVLSNKRDAFYVTTATSCSCPSSAYRPGQLCKHQRRYYPGVDAAKEVTRDYTDDIRPSGKWPGGRNGPVDSDEVA